MKTPIALICGPAGVGKDALASLIAKNFTGTLIAQADPLKRLGQAVFGFTEDQLWGPSSSRNAPDTRFDDVTAWANAWYSLGGGGRDWIQDAMPEMNDDQLNEAMNGLRSWFKDVAKAHGLVLRWGEVDRVEGYQYRALTARYVLQTLGTEFGRQHLSPTVWNDYAIRAAFKLLGGGHTYDRAAGLQEDVTAKIPGIVVITDGRFANEVMGVRRVGGSAVLVEGQTAVDGIGTAGVQGHRSEAELGTIPLRHFDFHVLNDKAEGLEGLGRAAALVGGTILGEPQRFVGYPWNRPLEERQAKDSAFLAAGRARQNAEDKR